MHGNSTKKEKVKMMIPFMLLMILITIVFSLFNYSIIYEEKEFSYSFKSIAILLIYNLLFIMKLICLFKTLLTNPGEIDQNLIKQNGLGKTSQNYCGACSIKRPERAKHCKICNKCFLRWDHHCSWIGNCIGLYNQKTFCLYLFYSTLENFFVFTVSLLKFILKIVYDGKLECSLHNIELLIIIIISMICLVFYGINLYNQFYLVINNLTTLEKKLYNYDITESIFYSPNKYENFAVIFGVDNCLDWFNPKFIVNEKNSGYDYVMNRNQQNLPLHTPTEISSTANVEEKQDKDKVYINLGDMSRSIVESPKSMDIILK